MLKLSIILIEKGLPYKVSFEYNKNSDKIFHDNSPINEFSKTQSDCETTQIDRNQMLNKRFQPHCHIIVASL